LDDISTTAKPSKYLGIALRDFKSTAVLITFGMKTSNVTALKTKIQDRVNAITSPYTFNNANVETYPYNIDEDFAIYGCAFFNNITMDDMDVFRGFEGDYADFLEANPDIHAYDVEYWMENGKNNIPD